MTLLNNIKMKQNEFKNTCNAVIPLLVPAILKSMSPL